MFRVTSLMVTLLAIVSPPAAAQTVILVRHAEKADVPSGDPPLSATGQQRAEALAVALRGARITAVFTTDFQRTRQTAAPLARQAGLEPVVLAVSRGGLAQHVAELVSRLRGRQEDLFVVVGHSNTVPAVVRALGANADDMAECEYSRFTTVLPGPPARTVVSRYGVPDEGCR